MRLFVTDTETTGFDPKKETLIEVAGCIYDTETKTIIESYQSLLPGTSNKAQDINNISPEALKKVSKVQLEDAKEIISALANSADFLVAHNASFDKNFYEKNGFHFTPKWVCSKKDITFPGKHSSKRLGHLCYDLNIPVLNAHSALHDVYILIELLKKVPDLEKQIEAFSLIEKEG